MSARTLSAREFHEARKFVDIEPGRIAYVERGEGPVALFLHGALLNGYQWRHQLCALSDFRRVIAVDLLAMGYTEMKPGQPLGMKSQARMLRAFLDALGVGQVDLVGNDSGGGAAQVFAAGHPERVRTLTLINCEVNDFDDQNEAFRRFREALASGTFVEAMKAATRDPAVGRKILALAYEHPESLTEDAILTYLAPLVASPARVEQMYAYVAATNKRDLLEIEAQQKAFRPPVLVMWGTADGFFPTKWAYWLRENLPNVEELVEVPGAPLFWPEERPELLNEKVRAFWSRQERPGR